MDDTGIYNSAGGNRNSFGFGYFMIAAASLAAIAATFLTANSSAVYETKLKIFSAIILLYPSFFFIVYLRQMRRNEQNEKAAAKQLFDTEIEGKLLALEEAGEFFGASLKPADMFRLVANRINELVPFTTCVLYTVGEDAARLKILLAAGENAQALIDLEIDSHKGLAGKTLVSRQSQLDEKLVFDKDAFGRSGWLENLTSAVAAPVLRGAEVFGVLVVYGSSEKLFDERSRTMLESVAERVAPLLSNSMAFERSVANSLTDTITNLPNERAFYLVLENQIAESQRFREERPLAILSVDIKNFAGLNEEYGHAGGDRILTFAAGIIKEQLRQMDFLARSAGDEFLAVLPTATGKTAAEIAGRIERAFSAKPFEIQPREKKHLRMNFGIATFLTDGETAGQLLQTAYLRRRQAETVGKSTVLPFPKEFAG